MPSLDALFRANSSHNPHNLAKPAKRTLDGADFSANHVDAFNIGKSSQPLIESRHLSRESMVLTGTFVSFFSGVPQALESRYSATYFGQPNRYKKVVRTYHRFGPVRSQSAVELLGTFRNFSQPTCDQAFYRAVRTVFGIERPDLLTYVQRVNLHTSWLLIVPCAEHAGGPSQRRCKCQPAVAGHPHQHPAHRTVCRHTRRPAGTGRQVDGPE